MKNLRLQQRENIVELVGMKKFVSLFICALALCQANAFMTFTGDLPQMSTAKNESGDPLYINTATVDSLSDLTVAKFFGIGVEHKNLIQAEYNSTLVKEGVKIGENAFLLSFQDTYQLCGGESYMDLYTALPAEDSYAKLFAFDMGWKYALNEILSFDIGGNFTYATKRVDAAGIAGRGTTFYGDIYVGFVADLPLTPFAYYVYNFDYEAHKIKVGINPTIPLERVFGIENLFLVGEAFFGYTNAGDWLNGYNNTSMHDVYSYVQAEAQIVYVYKKHWRFAVGGGYSFHDSTNPTSKANMGPRQNSWISTSIGFIF